MSGKKRILVLRYRFIGDTILTVPFLRNLRRAEPDAEITWVVSPGTTEVIKGIPYVDDLLVWDPVTIHADSSGGHRTLGQKLEFVKTLRGRNFDKAYVLKRSFSSALMGVFAGAGKRVGFNTEGRGLLLSTRVPYRGDCHEVENFLEVLRADNIPVLDDYLEYWLDPQEVARGDELLAGAGIGNGEPFALIHPFAAYPPRGWHLDDFASVACQLASEGLRPVILGGGRDKGSFEEVRDKFPASVVSLAGDASLRETMAILKRGTLFLGNDSGIMHLAAAAGIPLVALFGPQSPVRFAPWSRKARVIYKGFQCSPCRQKFFRECEPSERGKPRCIEEITVEEVFDTCKELLKEHCAR